MFQLWEYLKDWLYSIGKQKSITFYLFKIKTRDKISISTDPKLTYSGYHI